MASVKRLKKDIDYLTSAVVSDCLNCLAYGKNVDKIGEMVQNIVETHCEMRQRVSDGRGVGKKERKAYYKAVCKDLMAAVDGAFSQLSDLVKEA